MLRVEKDKDDPETLKEDEKRGIWVFFKLF